VESVQKKKIKLQATKTKISSRVSAGNEPRMRHVSRLRKSGISRIPPSRLLKFAEEKKGGEAAPFSVLGTGY
jgi:hypothetical protein